PGRNDDLVRRLSAIVRQTGHADFQKLFQRETMTIAPASLEIAVLVLGLLVLLFEAFAEEIDKRTFAVTAIAGLSTVLLASFFLAPSPLEAAPSGFWSFYT